MMKILRNFILLFSISILLICLNGCNNSEKTPKEKKEEINDNLKNNVNIEILDSIITTDIDGYIKNWYKIKIKNNNEQAIKFLFSRIKAYDRANIELRDIWNLKYSIQGYGLEEAIYMDKNSEKTIVVGFLGLGDYKNEIKRSEIDYEVSNPDSYRPVIFEGLEINKVKMNDNGSVTYTIKNNTEFAIEQFTICINYYHKNEKLGECVHQVPYFYSKESFYPGDEKELTVGTQYVYKSVENLPNEFNEIEYLSNEEIKETEVQVNFDFAFIDNNKTYEYNKANKVGLQ